MDPSKQPEPPPDIYSRHLVRAPGPGKYDLNKYSDFHPSARGAGRWSFGAKFHRRRDEDTPAPDKYAHQASPYGGPRWTMGARPQTIDKEALSRTIDDPSKRATAAPPAAVPSYIGKGGPKYSMSGRTHAPRADSTPAPGHYDPLAALKRVSTRAPAFSMGSKYRANNRDPYYAPDEKSRGSAVAPPPPVKSTLGQGPRYSFGARSHRLVRDDPSPGPGAYQPGWNETLGKGAPKFSMSARVRGRGVAYGFWGDEPRLGSRSALPNL